LFVEGECAVQGGVIACTGTDEFRRSFVGPFVDGALSAEIDVPTDPIESDFGFHVIRVRPFDEVRGELDFTAPDFVTTYAFRVVYYLHWHVLWGWARLQVLF